MLFLFVFLACCACSALGQSPAAICHGNQACSSRSARVETHKASKNTEPKPQLHCSAHRTCTEPNKDLSINILDCRCWENCHSYGDCCYNASGSQNTFTSSLKFQCVNPLPTGTSTRSYFMVADCPANWKDQEIKQLCTSVDLQDTYQTVPVTSLERYVTYRNIYCAACNSDIENITSWKAEFRVANCSFFSKAPLREILKKAEITSYEPEEIPQEYSTLAFRFCSTNFISKCNSKADESARLRCKKYYAPVEVDTGSSKVLYKNEFCALCSGFPVSAMRCADKHKIDDAALKNTAGQKKYLKVGCYDPDGGFTITGLERLIDIDFTKSSDSELKCAEGYNAVKWELADQRQAFKCVKAWKKKRQQQ